ncbi:MAG: MFS transporter [Actinomycetota bacterium]
MGSARESGSSSAGGSPLRRREFRLYFAGNLVSNVGTWLNNVTLAVVMRDLTHSSFWVGITGLGLGVPVLLFALPAGVMADRYDRLRLLRRAQTGLALLAASVTVLLGLGLAGRWVLAAASFGFGLGIAVAIPTMQALIPLMVPRNELADAIGLNALTFNLARAFGPVLAAITLVTLGATWAFGFNTASYFALIAALALVGRVPFPRAADRPPGPMREAIAYAWRHLRTRWMLLAIAAIGTSLDPITTLSPALVEVFGMRTGSAGWIVGSWGAGSALMILVGRRGIRAATERGLGWAGLLALGIGLIGIGAAPVFWVALVACAVTGAGYITATMAFTTTIQRDVPESLRGRVSALWTLAFLGPRAVSGIVDGALADAVGPRWTTASFAVVALVAAVVLRRVETLRGEPIPPPA